jgi:uncharacterized iron-regulated membrane protein
VVTHRYLGVVMGLLMLLWFLSGIAMLFARWPEVSDAQRAAGLRPIAWGQCCAFGDVQDVQQVMAARVEDLAGRPVLRFDGQVLDLATGRPVHHVTSDEAAQVAAAYAAGHGIAGKPGAARAVERDQWTVTGYFNKGRPFYVFAFDDPARTDVYVSARTGQVAQAVDRAGKVGAWLGPIPHWLYPEILRADTRLWAQVVIWTSVIGTFLTVTGLYLGIVSWRPWGDPRLTPFRGWMAWHHLSGLAAGILTLTWVASGLLSMNPWGLLESDGDPRVEQVAGAISFGDLREAVLAAKAEGVTARRIEAAPLGGRIYLMADGLRLDAAGRPAPLAAADLAAAGKRLGPARLAELMTAEDQYYRGHHEPVRLPVYRVILNDGLRVYLDPASGQVLGALDRTAASYRWWFEGLHRLDFIDGFDRGAGWAAAMTLLLLGATLGVATGVWLGFRRAKDDLRRLTRKAPKLS